MRICEHEDSCMLIGIACDTCWRKNTIVVDCRKCKNCTGESCLIYGDNVEKAVVACARDCFAKYELMEDDMRGEFDLSLDKMDKEAMLIVRKYAEEHVEVPIKGHPMVYIVWKAKVLQNRKYLLSTNLLDGMYYELTYNGDKKEWYLDVYKKRENKVIKMEE